MTDSVRSSHESAAALPAAVLWDFDGTLADTEPVWIRAEYALAERLGKSWSHEHALNCVGNSLIETGRYIARVLETDLDPAAIVDELMGRVVDELRTAEIPWRPGALELLGSLREHEIPCALVSASYRDILTAVLDRLPEGTFAEVVPGDEVERGKPDPQPYLLACERLGVAPGDAVVLEDSIPGCDSGTAAGAWVLAVKNLIDVPPAPRRGHLDTLAGLDAAGLAAAVAAIPTPQEAR